jgi:hypothetical protein
MVGLQPWQRPQQTCDAECGKMKQASFIDALCWYTKYQQLAVTAWKPVTERSA